MLDMTDRNASIFSERCGGGARILVRDTGLQSPAPDRCTLDVRQSAQVVVFSIFIPSASLDGLCWVFP